MHFVSHGVVHVCLYVYPKGGDFRLIRWWTLCVQEGFHSAVICWFVITGLDRLVMRKQLLLSRTEKFIHKKIHPIDRLNSFVGYTDLYLHKPGH